MKLSPKEILRWTAIAIFGGFALWLTIYIISRVVTSPFDWAGVLFSFAILVVIASPFYTIAHIFFTRQYRHLFNLLGLFSALIVFVTLDSLGGDFVAPTEIDTSNFFLVLLPAMLRLFGSFWVARWVYSFFRRLAEGPRLQPTNITNLEGSH